MNPLTTTYLAANQFHDFWNGNLGEWLRTKGLHIVLVIIAALIGTRIINWVAGKNRAPPQYRPRAGALGKRQAPRRRRLGDLLGGDRHPLHRGRRRRLRPARPADRFARRTGRRAGCRPRFRRPADRAGPAQRVLHHHREAIRFRRSGDADSHRVVRGPGHRRGRHLARDEAAYQRRRGVHHPERANRQGVEPVQGLGAGRGRHSGTHHCGPQQGQRCAARCGDCCHLRQAPGAVAARRARPDGCREHQGRHREPAHGGPHLPGKQFEVGRQLRAMVLRSLRQEGIVSPATKSNVAAVATST